jgi:hypothetical protein
MYLRCSYFLSLSAFDCIYFSADLSATCLSCSELDGRDLTPMSLGLSHSLSRYKLKFSPEKVDTMIVQVGLRNVDVLTHLCYVITVTYDMCWAGRFAEVSVSTCSMASMCCQRQH